MSINAIYNDGGWTFTYVDDFVEYIGTLNIDKLEGKIKTFLQACPNDIKKNFDKKNYTLNKMIDHYMLDLNIEYISEIISVMLVAQKSDMVEILHKKIDILLNKNKQLEDEINILKNPCKNLYYYNSFENFNINGNQLSIFAKNFVPKYIEFHKQQVNSTEEAIYEKYYNDNEKYALLNIEYMSRIRNLSVKEIICNLANNYNMLFASYKYLLIPGCWMPKILSIESFPTKLDNYLGKIEFINSSGNHHGIFAEFKELISNEDKIRLNLS